MGKLVNNDDAEPGGGGLIGGGQEPPAGLHLAVPSIHSSIDGEVKNYFYFYSYFQNFQMTHSFFAWLQNRFYYYFPSRSPWSGRYNYSILTCWTREGGAWGMVFFFLENSACLCPLKWSVWMKRTPLLELYFILRGRAINIRWILLFLARGATPILDAKLGFVSVKVGG